MAHSVDLLPSTFHFYYLLTALLPTKRKFRTHNADRVPRTIGFLILAYHDSIFSLIGRKRIV